MSVSGGSERHGTDSVKRVEDSGKEGDESTDQTVMNDPNRNRHLEHFQPMTITVFESWAFFFSEEDGINDKLEDQNTLQLKTRHGLVSQVISGDGLRWDGVTRSLSIWTFHSSVPIRNASTFSSQYLSPMATKRVKVQRWQCQLHK